MEYLSYAGRPRFESHKGTVDFSIDDDRILVVVNVVVLAFLPEVHFLVDGILHFHIVENLYQSLEKS